MFGFSHVWGQNKDGSPYAVGMTIGELKQELEKYEDTDEVCMAVCPKKYWNGGGYSGKLKATEIGSTNQIWLKGLVIDPSMEV